MSKHDPKKFEDVFDDISVKSKDFSHQFSKEWINEEIYAKIWWFGKSENNKLAFALSVIRYKGSQGYEQNKFEVLPKGIPYSEMEQFKNLLLEEISNKYVKWYCDGDEPVIGFVDPEQVLKIGRLIYDMMNGGKK